MPVLEFKTVQSIRQDDISAWFAFDDEYKEWLVEVFVRATGGVYHLVARYPGEQPSLEFLRERTVRHNAFSRRPYQPGQACNGSIGACVMALFINFCVAQKIDPIALRRSVCPNLPELTEQDIANLLEQANWEGTAYPEQWDKNSIKQLAESLHAINAHALAYAVDTEAVLQK